MPMRKCKSVIDEIDRITDGDATRVERVRFAMHLGMCDHCERYYRQYVAVKDALGKVEAADLPDDFDAVMSQLLDHVDAPEADRS